MFRIGQIFFAAGLFWIAECAQGDSLDQWNLRVSGVTNTLNSVTYGTNKFVAVGQAGTILVSTNNGTNWNNVSSGVTNTLNGIAWDQNLFVAVGNESTILTSPDASSWTRQTSPVINPLRNVRFVGGQFIATGAAGKLLTSTNGVDWISRDSGETFYRLEGAAYGNGIFCVVGGASPGSLSLTSTNGIVWSKQYLSFAYLHDVTYGNGVFVASGSGKIGISTNGINWTSLGYLVPRDELYGVAFAHKTFVVSGGNSAGIWQRIITTSDGVNWKNRIPINLTGTGNLQSVAYGNGYLITVGTMGLILHSDPILSLDADNFLPGGIKQLTLTGEKGRSYRFQFTDNFSHTNWTDITNFVSTSETTLLIDPTPGANERFYRAISP